MTAAAAHAAWHCQPDAVIAASLTDEIRDLHEALRTLAGERLSKVAFGRMLGRFKDVQLDGRTFKQGTNKHNITTYRIEAVARPKTGATRPTQKATASPSPNNLASALRHRRDPAPAGIKF